MPEPESPALVFVTDQRYNSLTETSIASLALFSTRPLQFYVYQDGYEGGVQQPLVDFLAAKGHSIRFRRLEDTPGASALHDEFALFPHISRTSLFKAHAINELATSHKAVLYIDPDVVALRTFDVEALRPANEPLAAVYDFVSYMDYNGQDLLLHTARTGRSGDYLNSGVMYFESRAWMELELMSRYLTALREHAVVCPYRHDAAGEYQGDCKNTDQCAFNMALAGRWRRLPFEWNAQKPVRHTRIWRDAVLRHYTGPHKVLTSSNRYRDWRELKLLQRLQREVGMAISMPRTYDLGFSFLVDALRYRTLTAKYRTVLRGLQQRLTPERLPS